MNEVYNQYPMESCIWLPRTNYTICPFMEFWLIILYQLVPGMIFDIGLTLTKSDKRFVFYIYNLLK